MAWIDLGSADAHLWRHVVEHGHGRGSIRQLHGLQLAHAEAAALVDEATAAERRLPECARILPWRAHQLLQLPAGDGLQQLLQAPARSALQPQVRSIALFAVGRGCMTFLLKSIRLLSCPCCGSLSPPAEQRLG